MRYADGPGTHCEVHVDATVEQVWRLVTDIGLPARLSPELQRVGWLDGADGAAPGARFEGHNHRDDMGDWRTVSQVIELAEYRSFAWAVVDPDGRYGAPVPTSSALSDDQGLDPAVALATWRFDLAPEEGGTRLRQSVVIGPGRSGVSLVIDRWPDREEQIVEYRLADLRKGMTATLEGIKALAEQGDRAGRAEG
ncbi:SRPBCC family protein [Kitasatospora sp. NPDC101176]|uniref:SRPBCC family protein n=1 Tax=Kitasatospora sp. NPDC101176 TaxID=3364099 RepID=UPI003800AB46